MHVSDRSWGGTGERANWRAPPQSTNQLHHFCWTARPRVQKLRSERLGLNSEEFVSLLGFKGWQSHWPCLCCNTSRAEMHAYDECGASSTPAAWSPLTNDVWMQHIKSSLVKAAHRETVGPGRSMNFARLVSRVPRAPGPASNAERCQISGFKFGVPQIETIWSPCKDVRCGHGLAKGFVWPRATI